MIDVRDQITNGYSGRYTLDPAKVIGIAIHHTVSGGDFAGAVLNDPEAELAHLKAIDVYHLAQGWGGFGYHLVIFSSGRLYYCGAITGARAHVASRNNELIGVAFVGNFTDRQPTWEAVLAGREAIAFIRQTYGPIPFHGHGYWALPASPTACPGDTWPQWSPDLQQWMPPPPPAEEEPVKLTLIKGDQRDEIYALSQGGRKSHIESLEHLEALAAAGVVDPSTTKVLPQAQVDAIPSWPG